MAILNNNTLVGASGNQGGYNINNSLRFRSSATASLSRTPASAGNRKTWTWSGWVKRGAIPSSDIFLFGNSGTLPFSGFYFGSGNNLKYRSYNGSSEYVQLFTTPVYRDPSAWYHIIVVLDTTQATASNRLKFYVNGVQVTAFSTATYPSLNSDEGINATNIHDLCSYAQIYVNLDGYLAEVNFIDGQALTPSSFGSTNATTGVWQPARYTGTYGTNGFYLPFGTLPSSTYAGSFNGSSQYLSLAGNTAFDLTGDFTIESFVYLNTLADNGIWGIQPTSGGGGIRLTYEAGSGGIRCIIPQNTSTLYLNIAGGTLVASNWYHIAVTRSGTTVSLFVNGIKLATGTTGSWAGTSTPLNISAGRNYNTGNLFYLNGYQSNFRVVKGTALYTSNFIPPSSSLTAVSGTSVLTLQNATIIDNSTNAFSITNNGSVTTTGGYYPYGSNALGKDSSGNNNNWATNNINGTTSGTTYDSMTDSPTNTSATVANYAVLNPLSKGTNVSITNANLAASYGSAAWTSAFGTIGVSTGKWYWEMTLTSAGTDAGVGISTNPAGSANSYIGGDANSWGYYASNGNKWNNNSQTSYGATYANGDVIGIALDLDAGTLVFYKNNVSQGTAFSSLASNTYFPALSVNNSSFAANFGQRPFSYTPPTGYVALNTYNLPTPTILQGNSYMDATLYTGTGSSLNVTGVNFQPDFVWIKERVGAADHGLYDAVRGVQKQLESNTTDAETTETTGLTAFNSNGFTVGALAQLNTNTDTYVGWSWKANGAGSSNTSGTITSTVSVNTTAGFSVVTYTGTGTTGTVGHGLGIAPRMIILKNRGIGTAGDGAWQVYHASLGNTQYLSLNTTAAAATSIARWNNTSPTSTVFTVATTGSVNDPSNTYVAYCWAEIAGFSAFGSYTGNGSTDGPFVFTNLKARFIMIKRTDSTSNWTILDTAREGYNVDNDPLYPNLSDAEGTTDLADILSNGFKLRSTDTSVNANAGTYIYACFSSNPFKNSTAV